MSGRSSRGRAAVRTGLAAISAAAALAAYSTETPDTPGDTESPASRSNSAYADGECTARGWYGGLPSSIEVTVALDDGVITDAEVAPQATDPTSRDYQERFAAAFRTASTKRSAGSRTKHPADAVSGK